MAGVNDTFFTDLPVFDGFARVVDPDLYQPLPHDWSVGFADVVGSTEALEQGRYKTVNMAGAGVIAAVANATGGRTFPYCFGGDGASFAVHPGDSALATNALRAMATFAIEELHLDMRVATVPVAMIRAAGMDVRVARFAPSPNVSYAMFSGGGLGWLESLVKNGQYRLEAAAPGTRPDLMGLSCRWKIEAAMHGVILSVIAVPRPGKEDAFRALAEQLIGMADIAAGHASPVSPATLKTRWPGQGISLETSTRLRRGKSRWMERLKVLSETFLATIFLKFNLKAGEFDPAAYTRDVAANADFRKYDDGLKMTIDCSPALADSIDAMLLAAEDITAYGTFRQDEALMTCFVPSVTERSHVHFVDGAGGGYSLAAKAMKQRLG